MAEAEAAADEIPGASQDLKHDEASLTTPPSDHHLPPSSLLDSGQSKRPRDARLFHMVLASYGVTAYQERVPLQLMDFAYRYTSSTLSDALHFSSEGYGHTSSNASSGIAKGAASNTLSDITAPALRLSIHSRTHYQYSPVLPTTVYNEIAQERNRVALPAVRKEVGLMLPPEQYCLTANGFQLEEEEALETADEDAIMKMDETIDNEDEGGDETEGGKMEDLFGDQLDADNAEVALQQ